MRTFLDPSVIYLRAGAHPVVGSDAALALIEAVRPEVAPFVAWQPLGGGLSRDRLAGYTFGIAVRAQAEQPTVHVERYVAFWSRMPGGAWRITGYAEVSPGSLSTGPGAAAPIARDANAALRSMIAADSGFSERAAAVGPSAASRETISEDGVLLLPTQLIVGPGAVADYFASLRSFSVSWLPLSGRIAGSGDLGFTVGNAVLTTAGPTGAATQRFTKYLSVWRKDPDGKWRILVTGGNDRPSPIGN